MKPILKKIFFLGMFFISQGLFAAYGAVGGFLGVSPIIQLINNNYQSLNSLVMKVQNNFFLSAEDMAVLQNIKTNIQQFNQLNISHLSSYPIAIEQLSKIQLWLPVVEGYLQKQQVAAAAVFAAQQEAEKRARIRQKINSMKERLQFLDARIAAQAREIGIDQKEAGGGAAAAAARPGGDAQPKSILKKGLVRPSKGNIRFSENLKDADEGVYIEKDPYSKEAVLYRNTKFSPEEFKVHSLGNREFEMEENLAKKLTLKEEKAIEEHVSQIKKHGSLQDNAVSQFYSDPKIIIQRKIIDFLLRMANNRIVTILEDEGVKYNIFTPQGLKDYFTVRNVITEFESICQELEINSQDLLKYFFDFGNNGERTPEQQKIMRTKMYNFIKILLNKQLAAQPVSSARPAAARAGGAAEARGGGAAAAAALVNQQPEAVADRFDVETAEAIKRSLEEQALPNPDSRGAKGKQPSAQQFGSPEEAAEAIRQQKRAELERMQQDHDFELMRVLAESKAEAARGGAAAMPLIGDDYDEDAALAKALAASEAEAARGGAAAVPVEDKDDAKVAEKIVKLHDLFDNYFNINNTQTTCAGNTLNLTDGFEVKDLWDIFLESLANPDYIRLLDSQKDDLLKKLRKKIEDVLDPKTAPKASWFGN